MPCLTVSDGVSLAYDDAGDGQPPMIFVHGWTADRSIFAAQASHFARLHRVVSLDLRGHGVSDKPKDRYSMDLFAEDVAWMCARLGVQHAILVGHSMGGLVVLELAARHPELAIALILLDTPVFPPAGLVTAMQAVAREFRGPNYAEAARRFVDGVFLPTDHVRREQVLQSVVGCPKHVLSPSWEQQINYDASPAAAVCRVPLCYIGAATPLADLSRLRALCPQLVSGQTVGSGHFHTLEVPGQINAMIEQFLLTALRRSTAPS
jgi:pimeloyl-ACP methyl ester carboxylesterase